MRIGVLAHHARVGARGDGARLVKMGQEMPDALQRRLQPVELGPFAARFESRHRVQPPVGEQETAAGRHTEVAFRQSLADRVAVLATRAEADIDARALDQAALFGRRKRRAPGVDERMSGAKSGEPLRERGEEFRSRLVLLVALACEVAALLADRDFAADARVGCFADRRDVGDAVRIADGPVYRYRSTILSG